MTRRIVYGVGVWVALAATIMTIVSIVMPRWIKWDSYDGENPEHFTYGLHERCSSVTGMCEPFPRFEDCQRGNVTFCSLWRSVGFLMSFAVIIEFSTFIAFAVVLLGGVQQRSYGWKIVCALLTLSAVVQCAGMAIIAYLYDNDERFFPGWRLDTSWVLCTISWSLLILTAAGIGGTVYILPEEGGYELFLNTE